MERLLLADSEPRCTWSAAVSDHRSGVLTEDVMPREKANKKMSLRATAIDGCNSFVADWTARPNESRGRCSEIMWVAPRDSSRGSLAKVGSESCPAIIFQVSGA